MPVFLCRSYKCAYISVWWSCIFFKSQISQKNHWKRRVPSDASIFKYMHSTNGTDWPCLKPIRHLKRPKCARGIQKHFQYKFQLLLFIFMDSVWRSASTILSNVYMVRTHCEIPVVFFICDLCLLNVFFTYVHMYIYMYIFTDVHNIAMNFSFMFIYALMVVVYMCVWKAPPKINWVFDRTIYTHTHLVHYGIPNNLANTQRTHK